VDFFYNVLEPFNRSSRAIKAVLVNQFGWSRDRCGLSRSYNPPRSAAQSRMSRAGIVSWTTITRHVCVQSGQDLRVSV
jgi:hypothetical protein